MLDDQIDHSAPAPALIRAAQYVRMSSQFQPYSIERQLATIGQYAEERGMVIVRTYADAARSGLTIRRRAGLQQLLEDVQRRGKEFEVLLVYDVSRLGRFQDVDEAAHYEFICKQAGVRIAYCTEPFENDGSALASVVKNIKRVMAAEYSRELSAIIKRAQCASARRGHHVGSIPTIGFRRVVVRPDGVVRQVMKVRESKFLKSDHTELIPGPPEEIALINRIFRMFTQDWMSEQAIAEKLNQERVFNGRGRIWRYRTIRNLLANEKFIGVATYNKCTHTLGTRRKRDNPASEWIRIEDAHPPIVDPAVFAKAQEILRSRRTRLSREQMLEKLASLYEREGRLSYRLMLAEPDMPCPKTYDLAFGSVYEAYKLVGCTPSRDTTYIQFKRAMRAEIEALFRSRGHHVQSFGKASYRIDGQWTLTFIAVKRRLLPKGDYWQVRLDRMAPRTVTAAARMNADGTAALDYYLFPEALSGHSLYLREADPRYRPYRHDSLAALLDLIPPSI